MSPSALVFIPIGKLLHYAIPDSKARDWGEQVHNVNKACNK